MESRLKEIKLTGTEDGRPVKVETRLVESISYWIRDERFDAYVLAQSIKGNAPQIFLSRENARDAAKHYGLNPDEFSVEQRFHKEYGYWYVLRKEKPPTPQPNPEAESVIERKPDET